MKKPKIAIVRGKFLNKYEMQFYEPLTRDFDITAFGSLTCYHDRFTFPVIKLPSPMDLPEFPYKMPICNRMFIDAQYLFELEKNLKDFDIVHSAETYFHYTQQSLNAKKRGYTKKVIATVLENIPFNNEGIWGRKSFKRRAREELDWMIALTQKTKAAIVAEGADAKKISVISHFVDTKRFVPSGKTLQNKKDITIVFCGRLEEYKGVFDILLAAKKLLSDRSLRTYDISFVFVGNGSAKISMLLMQQRLGIHRFVHYQQVAYEHMPLVYQNADIFVAPSKPTKTWEEQYCTVLLEAQAAGLPIVTTHTGGIPENVGDAAMVVEPGDIDAIAAALKQFIMDNTLRAAYSKKARSRALGAHDIRFGSEKLRALYETLLGK